MFIQKSLLYIEGFYTKLIKGTQESTSVDFHDNGNQFLEVSTERLSKATLDKQPDGSLRFMTINRCGFSEFKIFNTETQLDAFLSRNENVDIWEIQDKRGGETTTLYKYYDGEEEVTFTNKKELYEEIAFGADHGIFSIYEVDTQKAKYIQQNKSWFHRGFEDISLEQAQKNLCARERAKARWRTLAAAGIAVLTTTSIVGIQRILPKNVIDLSNKGSDLVNLPNFYSLAKITAVFSAAVLHTEGFGGKTMPMVFSLALISAISSLKSAKAQTLCPVRTAQWSVSGLARDVDVVGNKAYLISNWDGMQVLNVTNRMSPILIGSYNNFLGGQPEGVTLVGDIAFVASGYKGLLIINVTNGISPRFVGWYDTIGYALRVSISGNRAYIADDSALQIIDITNLATPSFIGSYTTFSNASVKDVVISGNMAYVASGDAGLQIIDISSETNPRFVGWYNTEGTAYSVSLSNNIAYVADGNSGLKIIDVVNGTNPILVGSYNTRGDARDVTISGNIVFVANDYTLNILDATNKSDLTLLGLYRSSGYYLGVATTNDLAFLAGTFIGLEIIDVSVHCPSTTTSTSSSITTSTSSSITTSTSSSAILLRSTSTINSVSPSLPSFLLIGVSGLIAGIASRQGLSKI